MSTQTRQEIESAPRQDAFGRVLMVLADCRERYEPKDAEWRALADATEAIHRLLDVRAVLTESRDACQRENSRLALAKQAAEQQFATLTKALEKLPRYGLDVSGHMMEFSSGEWLHREAALAAVRGEPHVFKLGITPACDVCGGPEWNSVHVKPAVRGER
jgi:hypothetical protein